MAVAISRMDLTAGELRDLAVKSRDVPQSRRLLAIAMVLDGSSREDAAARREWIGKPCVIGCIAITRVVRRG